MPDKPADVPAHEYSYPGARPDASRGEVAGETSGIAGETPLDDDDLEWDETPTSLQLRALFALLAGGFLLWSQARAPLLSQSVSGTIRTPEDWNRFVRMAVFANGLLPLGIVTLFFAQYVRLWPTHIIARVMSRLEAFSDYTRALPLLLNRNNAWGYGTGFRDWKKHLKWSATLFVVAAPLVWMAARDASSRTILEAHLPILPSSSGMSTHVRVGVSLLVLALCREWFFRGFLLFAMAQAVGPIVAVGLQAIVWALVCGTTFSIPVAVVFAVGVLFGTATWRLKSFAPAFHAHALLLVLWMLLTR